MFKHLLTVGWRHLKKGGLYSVMNISGLAIGLACFFLIVLFVRDELAYDKFHKKQERIHRVIGILNLEGQGEESSSCPFPVGPSLSNDYPHLIEHCVRFFNFQDPQHTLRAGDIKINESRIFMADSNVFEVFDFPLLKGDPRQVLQNPNSIVMTEKMAEKYFGSSNPIGKIVKFDGSKDLMVTGILDKIPTQSHIHFDALVSFSTLKTIMGQQTKNWVWNPNWTYVLLKPGVTSQQLSDELPAFVQKYYPDFLKPQVKHILQPLSDIHLYSKYDYEIEPNGDMNTLYIFTIIAVFILLLACINFVNLSTARSARRSREIGIRKVAGATRTMFIKQFLSESLLTTCIALIFAFIIMLVFLPVFNSFSGKSMLISELLNPQFLGIIILVTICTGLFSGLYPALYLSSFNAVQVLKGQTQDSHKNTPLRKILVVFQFTISVMLICGTGMVYKQLTYMQNASVGFDSQQVLMLPVRPPMAPIFKPLMTDLKAMKDVLGVATMNDVAGKHHNTHEYNYKGMQAGKWIYYPSLLVSEDFVSTMKMQILAGRDFSVEYPRDDTAAVIVNEAMVKHMGWGSNEKAIGEQMFTPTGNERVIGVVKDFHFESLHTPLGPFVLDIPHQFHRPYWTRYIAVRLNTADVKTTIGNIENVWNKYSSEFPFDYFFLDDALGKQYEAQENLVNLVAFFSILAVFIACLGLFALVAYQSELRVKEIGIRKVLGAGIQDVLLLLSKDFMLLISIAILIAWPLSWLVVNKWLENFAFRTDISYMLFITAGIAALLIALLTISIQVLKSSAQDPVKSLRYE